MMPYISTESGRLTAEQKKQLIERLTATGDVRLSVLYFCDKVGFSVR